MIKRQNTRCGRPVVSDPPNDNSSNSTNSTPCLADLRKANKMDAVKKTSWGRPG